MALGGLGSFLGPITQIGFTLAGYYIGGPFGGFIGSVLGAYVAGELFGSDVTVTQGRLQDLKQNISAYGTPIQVIYGCARTGGVPYFNSDLIEIGSKRTRDGVSVISFHYFIDIGYILCDSPPHFPVIAVPKVWGNGKLIVDTTNLTGPIVSFKYVGTTNFTQSVFSGNGQIRIRFGTEDQEPDAMYEEKYGGVGTTPGDRGKAAIILEKFPVEDFGNTAPQITALCCTAAVGAFPKVAMNQLTQNTGSLRWHPNGRYLYAFGKDPTPYLVNSDTREFVVAPGSRQIQPVVGSGNSDGDNPGGFYDMNARGQGIAADANLSNVLTMFLVDVETYTTIMRSSLGDSEIVTSGADAFFYGLEGDYILVTGNSGQTYTAYSTAAAVPASPALGDTFTGTKMAKIIKGVWADNGLATFPEHAIDGQTGHVWTGHQSGSDYILVHWNLSMVELERFTVTGRSAGEMGYDSKSHSFYFLEGIDTMWRWDIAAQAIFPTILTLPSNTASTAPAFEQGTFNGLVYLQAGNFGPNIQVVDIPTMTHVKSYDILNDWGESNVQGPIYDPFLHAVIVSDATNNPVWWIFLDRADGDAVTLESILNNMVLRSGYESAGDRDASDHSATLVSGFQIPNKSEIAQESQHLAELYKFGHVESDHKIKFPARGRATTFALTDDDLGVISFGDEPTRKLYITRIDQSELPTQSEINFIDPELDWQDGLQRAYLVPETVPGTDRSEERQFRVALTNEEAARRAYIHLRQLYADQQRYKFTTFHSKLTIDPGDTGTITSDGTTHLVMIEEANLGANFIYECTAVGFTIPSAAGADAILAEIHSLETALAAQAGDGFIDQTLPQLNQTNFLVLDIPFLLDSVDPGSDQLLNHIVASRNSDGVGWDGSEVLRSPDGVTYGPLAFYKPEDEAALGLVTTTLGDYERWTVFDDTNTVDVVFPEDVVLATVSDAELLLNRNAFVIGDEIILAGTITDLGNGEWRLAHLLRGRRGTDWAISTHTQWDRAIFVGDESNGYNFTPAPIPLADDDVNYFYQALTLGNGDIGGTSKQFINSGRSHMPYAPANVGGVKSGGDWVITWIPRTRTGGELRDFADVTLSDPEVYEVEILDINQNVVRTITSTASANGSVVSGRTATYDQVDIEADFGESPVVSHYPLYRLYVKVYQVNNETVGRGFSKIKFLENFPDPIPSDASFASVSLLLHCNSLTPRDKSGNKLGLLTVGSALTLVSGTWLDGVSQYGTAVIDFQNAANNELILERAKLGTLFDLGAGNFTLEAWVHQDVEQNGVLVGVWNASPNREWVWLYRTGVTDRGAMEFRWTTDGSTEISSDGSGATIPSGSSLGLVHIAVTRNGSTGQLYRNGVALGSSFTISGTIFSGGNADLRIGITGTGSSQFQGKIDSMRITKGVARYTGSTYAIPSHRFSNR